MTRNQVLFAAGWIVALIALAFKFYRVRAAFRPSATVGNRISRAAVAVGAIIVFGGLATLPSNALGLSRSALTALLYFGGALGLVGAFFMGLTSGEESSAASDANRDSAS